MKLNILVPLAVTVTALPAAIDRVAIAKADGLKFNIDGVTKCPYIALL